MVDIDWVVECDGTYVPIEVKWTDSPNAGDTRHLNCFLKEYPTFGQGYVVCRVPRKTRISDHVTALPWQTFLNDMQFSSPPAPAP